MVENLQLLISKSRYNLATYLFSFSVVISFYSFGTFGLLNLWGLKNSFQFVSILFSFFGIISIIYNLKRNKEYTSFLLMIVMFGFIYYGVILSLIKGEILATLVQSFLMLIFALYLLLVDIKYIHIISKTIIWCTFILSVLGLIAYFAFIIDSDLINKVNFNIYDSTSGSKTIYAKSWVEYFSFTSGDGFEFFGLNITRVKSFCNEPSATIVHILAPAGLAFIYAIRYQLKGFFILIFNFIGIGSLMSWIPIFVTLALYLILSLKSKILKKSIIFLSILVLVIIMLNIDFAVSSILNTGNYLQETTSTSLLARKEGSAITRLMSFSTAIKELQSHILGGSSYSTMTGLILNLSMVGGIFLFVLLLLFSIKIIDLGEKKFKYSTRKHEKYAVSFILSVFFTAILLSSYGWDRIPGVIMLMLFYRHLKENSFDKSIEGKNGAS